MYQEEKIDTQTKSRISTEPVENSARRKPPIAGSGFSDRRKIKNSKEDSEELLERQSVTSSTAGNVAITLEDQQKMMVLSAEARQALIEMQRFDRFIYVMESQKRLKGPIQKQLARLEKIKNSGNKSMKNNYFDNQLTITCLYNHMKNMYQMNRDLGEIVVLKAQIQALQQKIIEQNMKYNKDIKEASSTARGKFAEESQQLKQILKFHQNIISALKETHLDRAKKKLQVQIKKSTEDRKQILELISNLVSRANADTSSALIDTYMTTLDKITQDQEDINKNIEYLVKQKKTIQKQLAEPRLDEAKKKVYQQLLYTVQYIISIYQLAKTGSGSVVNVPKAQKSQDTNQQKKVIKDLENQLKSIQDQTNNWTLELENLTSRVQKDQNIGMDVNKHKKLLNVKKNMDPTLSKFLQATLNILQIFSKKMRDQSQAGNAEKDRINQISNLTKTNAALQKELHQLREQLAKNSKTSQKQPNVQAEWSKLLNVINEAFDKRESNDPSASAQVNKARKYIELNRKKFPAELHDLLNTIQYLIRLIIDCDQNFKQIDQDQQKRQQLLGKQIGNLDVYTKSLQKLLTAGDAFNDGFLNKLKKNLQGAFNKLQKQERTPLLNLYLGDLQNIWKIIELLENVHKGAKSKGQNEVKKQQYDNVRDQLKAKDLQIKNLKQQTGNLDKKIQDYERKIKQFEKKLQNNEKQQGDKRSVIQQQRKERQRMQGLQREIQGYKQKIKSLQKSIQALNKNIDQAKKQKDGLLRQKEDVMRQKQSLILQHDKEIKKVMTNTSNNSNLKDLERQNNDLKKSIESLNKSINEGKNTNKQTQRLKREVQQLKNIQNAQQESVNLKNQQIQNLKRKVKELERSSRTDKNQEVKIAVPKDSGQGVQYWRERYQASKMQNQVLRDELATLERRFDEVHIIQNQYPITITKSQGYSEQDVNKLKASLSNQEALVLSKSLEIQRYQSQIEDYKSNIQNLNQKLRSTQLDAGSNQQANIRQQLTNLVNENTKLQEEIINIKQQLNSTIDNLIFVDGQNFKINESFKKSEQKCKLLEERYKTLQNNVKAGRQVTKLRDEKQDLQNKYEDLRRQMDIVVSELQSYKEGDKKGNFLRMPGTPKGNKIATSEWTTSSQVYNTQSSTAHTKSQSSRNYHSDKGKQVQILTDRIQKLESEKQALVQRLNLLNIFSDSMTGVNQTFIDNVNKLVQKTIRFMIDFEGLSEDRIVDVNLVSAMSESIKKGEYSKYFQVCEQYLRNSITGLLVSKGTITGIQSQEVITQSILVKESVQEVSNIPKRRKK